MASPNNTIDNTSIGTVYGKWTIVEGGHYEDGRAYCVCRCECGLIRSIRVRSLKTSETTQCLKCSRRSKPGRRTHGKCTTPEYNVWQHMKRRCLDVNNKRFHRYGGRGITVCDRWQNSFEAFLSDMGPRPSARHSIERLNNDGNYDPGNCIWATPTEQRRNTSRIIPLTVNGQTRLITDWARLMGVSYLTIYMRLTKLGWDEEDAVLTPVRKRGR